MANQLHVAAGHQQAPVGIVNPTPRSNNKNLSTMDLRHLSTQPISNEQKQIFRLSAPLCPHSYILPNEQTRNDKPNPSRMYRCNESRSTEQFKNRGNDASTLYRVPENTINKSKSNMDIRSYHILQQTLLGNEGHQSRCTSNKCAQLDHNVTEMHQSYQCCTVRNDHTLQNVPTC